MRTTALLLFAITFAASIHADRLGLGFNSFTPSRAQTSSISKHFYVSKVGTRGADETRESLIELFAKVKRSVELDRSSIIDGKVLQNLEGDLYLVEWGDRFVALQVASGQRYVDGDSIVVPVQGIGDHEYGDTQGAKRRILKFKAVSADSYLFTREEFISRLKQGESFQTSMLEEITCQPCRGSGYTGSSLDRTKKPCRRCKGTKVEMGNVAYKLSW
jgi:hypothetical protein